MGKYRFIEINRTDGCCRLLLNHPPLNIIHLEMLAELIAGIEEVQSDPESRVLVIQGNGRCFSAGMAVQDHFPETLGSMLEKMRVLFEKLYALEIPTVSLVHGSALGGGMELAIATDMTFASSDAKFGQPEIQLGVIPPVAAAWLNKLIPPVHASYLVLTGLTVDADKALQMGLINEVFPADEFETSAGEVVSVLSGHSRPILIAAKKALRISRSTDRMSALGAAEHIYVEEVMQTDDALEGLRSFVQKRKPVWRHR